METHNGNQDLVKQAKTNYDLSVRSFWFKVSKFIIMIANLCYFTQTGFQFSSNVVVLYPVP
jgi:hypothetical protein